MSRKEEPLTHNEQIAQRMRETGSRTQESHTGIDLAGDKGLSAQIAIPTFLFITAAFLALGEGMGVYKKIPLELPYLDEAYNQIIFAARPQPVLGHALADAVLAAAAQALVVCLFAAVLPTVVKYWRRARDQARGNLYISVWGMTIGLPFAVVLSCDFLWPILRDIASGF